jgi:predicted nucleotidyltransferase
VNLEDRLPYCDDDFADVVESFYLETLDGLFFAVKGLEHPPDRFIAILRYAPDPEDGDRKKNGKSYRRFYHFAEQERLIRTAYPQYLADDPVFGTTLQSVPRSLVQQIYDPRHGLRKLAQSPAGKDIKEDAAAFAGLLQRETGVPWTGLGITGSLLIGLHHELSDLDVVVFGTGNCQKVYQALGRLLDAESETDVRRLDPRSVEELYAQRLADTRMDFRDFVNAERYKVNQGSFRKRTYFIRFVKEAREAGGIYGHLRYTPLGRMAITASVADAREAIFTPCRYLLSGARSLEGQQLPDLNEIVSFRGRFCEQARTGESVMAAGTLERVENSRGDAWRRLLLGNSPEDTMVAWR